jgi:L-threonylcarbamoyladenylate synthase
MMFLFDKIDLEQALNVLKRGGVILYPTDTIWGLGCDATRRDGVDKIFSIKNRREAQSLIILVSGLTMLEQYTEEIPEIAFSLLDVADKPLTLIYPGGKNLAHGICADDGSVGIRVCEEPFCSELITMLGKPVVSTSANVTDRPPPSNFSGIDKYIIDSADYVVKYRQEDTSSFPPSQVIKLGKDGTIKIIRK